MTYVIKEGIFPKERLPTQNILQVQDMALLKDFLEYNKSEEIHIVAEDVHTYKDFLETFPANITLHLIGSSHPDILQTRTLLIEGLWYDRTILKFKEFEDLDTLLLVGSSSEEYSEFLGAKGSILPQVYSTKYIHIPLPKVTRIYNPHTKKGSTLRPQDVFFLKTEYHQVRDVLRNYIPIDSPKTIFLHIDETGNLLDLTDIIPILYQPNTTVTIVAQTILTEKDKGVLQYIRTLGARIILPPRYLDNNQYVIEHYSDILYSIYEIQEQPVDKVILDISTLYFKQVPYEIYIKPSEIEDLEAIQVFFNRVLTIAKALGKKHLFQGPYHLTENQDLLASTIVFGKSTIRTIFGHPIYIDTMQQNLASFAQQVQEEKASKLYEVAAALNIPFASGYLDFFTASNVHAAGQWYFVKLILSGEFTNY